MVVVIATRRRSESDFRTCRRAEQTLECEDDRLFKAKAVNGEESYCYRATLVWE